MTDPFNPHEPRDPRERDRVDDWLSREVEPLYPAPGTFERVHRRAGRRKLHQAMLAAAGAVLIIGTAAAVPSFAPALLSGHGGPQRPLADASAVPSARSTAASTSTPSTSSRSATSSAATAAAPPAADGTGLSVTTSGTAPPPHFRPTSITMISDSVGAVIGQAGPPCASQYCTSLAGTSTYGASWYGVSAPRAGPARGATGVGQLRFLNLSYGWAFGPELFATSDGGRHWSAEPTGGLRVTSLETAGNRAFALFATCTGTGSDALAACSTYSLRTTVAGSASWQAVALKVPAADRATAMGVAGQPASASLVLAGGKGFLLTPGGQLLGGSLDGGAWLYLGTAPCQPGRALRSGQPRQAQLAVSQGRMLIDCTTGSLPVQPKQVWSSADGSQWSKLSTPALAGRATALASAGKGNTGPAVLATTTGIDYSPDDGATWSPATVTGGAPAGGFSYVGMTSARQGVAVPADAAAGEVFTTTDGGVTWTASRIAGS